MCQSCILDAPKLDCLSCALSERERVCLHAEAKVALKKFFHMFWFTIIYIRPVGEMKHNCSTTYSPTLHSDNIEVVVVVDV